MAEVGISRDGEHEIAVVIRVPVSAFEGAGLTAAPETSRSSTSPGAAAAAPPPSPEPVAAEPKPGESGHALGPSGDRDLSPPSEGNNPAPDKDTVEPPKKPSRSRSRSKASGKSPARKRAAKK